jgi:hypothetical protein
MHFLKMVEHILVFKPERVSQQGEVSAFLGEEVDKLEGRGIYILLIEKE